MGLYSGCEKPFKLPHDARIGRKHEMFACLFFLLIGLGRISLVFVGSQKLRDFVLHVSRNTRD